MNIFTQYRGLRKENYILFLGRIVTNLGSMIWPVLTMILNQKMGMDATMVAIVTVVSSIILLPAGLLGGKLADKYKKESQMHTAPTFRITTSSSKFLQLQESGNNSLFKISMPKNTLDCHKENLDVQFE